MTHTQQTGELLVEMYKSVENLGGANPRGSLVEGTGRWKKKKNRDFRNRVTAPGWCDVTE